ncbi:MAG TPA: chemotaxis protein CheW [Gemmatimonadaceae bacterium]|nr:chemotaxis protein CheW [Gemmatimonadaceae bacterium]
MNSFAARSTTERQPLVVFGVGADLFAVDVHLVERVLQYREPAAVPNLPDWAVGVLQYRGQVVPVLDLRRRFELAETPARADRKIVVFEGPDGWVAAVVDSVREVNAVDPALVAAPPPLFRGLAREYLVGVLQDGDRLVMVLDAARLLSSTERLELEWATTGLTLGE